MANDCWGPAQDAIAHREDREREERGGLGMPTLGKVARGLPPIFGDRKADRVIDIIIEAQHLYRRKASGYKTADGDTANVLGAKGQFADINRKFWKLKGMLWDETIDMYPDAGMGESVEEVLMDLIGHAALTIDFLRQSQGENEEGTQ